MYAVLAHIAFWDRCALARWEYYPDARAFVGVDTEIVNAAALPQWRALAPHAASRDAVVAAEETDARIAAMPEAAIHEMLKRDRAWMTDRSPHRNAHLDEIERAIAR